MLLAHVARYIHGLKQKTAKFVDSLPLFRQGCPGLDSYKQESLYQHFFGDVFAAYGALADAEALHKLGEHVQFAKELLAQHSFPWTLFQDAEFLSSKERHDYQLGASCGKECSVKVNGRKSCLFWSKC